MKLYRIRKHDGEVLLNLEQQATPAPGPHEVLVKINAVSLNYRDLLILSGNYFGLDIEGLIPISDGAGEVLEVGEGVKNFKKGDRVTGCFFQNWEHGLYTDAAGASALGGGVHGLLAEEAVLAEKGLVKTPAHLSDEEAATLPCAALTAWNGLFTRGHLHSGQTVLVQGTGGVSMFGLQLAVAAGARVIVTSSSDEKLEKALSLGAWKGINYRTKPDWEQEVWHLTEERGVDHILEVGGVGTLEKSLRALAPAGHIAFIGVLAGLSGAVNPFPLALKNGTISGIYVGSKEQFEEMNAFIETHRIHPVVDRVFPFSEAKEAFDYLQSAKHFGKVVIKG